jgi:hypothetical protein
MKLFTNENNPLSLKVLIAANFALKEVKSEIANVDGKFRLSHPYGRKALSKS